MIKKIDWDLESWAMWKYKSVSGVSYSSESMTYRMMQGIPSSGTHGPQIPAYIGSRYNSRLNQIIIEMPRDWQQVITAKYKLYDDKDLNNLPGWAVLDMKKRTFYDKLHKIHTHIQSELIR